MGQAITVISRSGVRPDVRIFKLDRSLTGMAIERYVAATPPVGNRPTDQLARKLLELGSAAVSVYSNEVIVEAPAQVWSKLEPAITEVIENLFIYYPAE